jgi:hypothetical protein
MKNTRANCQELARSESSGDDMDKRATLLLGLCWTLACGDDDPKGVATATLDASASVADAGALDGGTHSNGQTDHSDAGSVEVASAALTYFHDMVPLFEAHCLSCHQQGGIAPFRLDDYATAKAQAPLIAHSTGARTMPPWNITSDGTCGTFEHSLALSDAQIASIGKWVADGAQEGVPGSVRVPPVETLSSASEYATPAGYIPEIQGGELAEADDYRCFLFEPGIDENRFITGYDVVPGTPEVVHHVLVSVIDPAGASDSMPGQTNAEVIDALDKQSPDRAGWPCFGLAGEGVAIESVPVVWAPGQGVVKFPGDSGVLLSPKHKVVVQIHYNLADPKQRGKADSTRVRLQLASQVANLGLFQLPDGLLESLGNPVPDQLPAGQASVPYTWKRSLSELGLDGVPGLKLYGVMPHMHQRGVKYQLRVKSADSQPMACAADVQRWDFHWQRMYFYEQPWAIGAGAEFELTCDFDTSDATSPVLPGWGTRNEMCLATLYFTVPVGALTK